MAITEEDVHAYAGEERPRAVCPECGKDFPGPAQLRGHMMSHAERSPRQGRAARSRTRSKPRATSAPRPTTLEAELKAIEDELVTNIAFVGGAVGFLALHTGLMLNMRAAPMAEVLMAQARKDERILKAIRRFNGAFGGGSAAFLGLSLVAAVAIDVGVIGPDDGAHIPLPSGQVATIGPRLLIGDVIEAAEKIRGETEAPPSPVAASPFPPAAGPVIVEGGMDAT